MSLEKTKGLMVGKHMDPSEVLPVELVNGAMLGTSPISEVQWRGHC